MQQIIHVKVFVLCTAGDHISLTSCKIDSNEKRTVNGQNFLTYDTSIIAIIPWYKHSSYPFDSSKYVPAILEQQNLNQLDSLLVIAVIEHNSSLSEVNGDFRIDLEGKNYRKQLVVARSLTGETEGWLNCFCDEFRVKSWRTEIFSVEDGGPCYFNLRINLSKKAFYDFTVNGYA